MPMKDLAALVSDAAADPAADAILLAKQLGAHLTAIAISPEPSPLYFVASGSDVIEGDRRSAAASARQQLDRFPEQALRSGLEFETRHIAGPIDLAAAEAARLSRHYDLTVVAQAKSDKDGAWNRILEAVLLDSGRPVIALPEWWKEPSLLTNAVLAWDGSAPAARALADALPLLRRSERVEIVTVATGDLESERVDHSGIKRHLGRHGIGAATRILSDGEPVSGALLAHVSDVGATLLIMGAFGHSRLREIFLGGTTVDILGSMKIPVLLSH